MRSHERIQWKTSPKDFFIQLREFHIPGERIYKFVTLLYAKIELEIQVFENNILLNRKWLN